MLFLVASIFKKILLNKYIWIIVKKKNFKKNKKQLREKQARMSPVVFSVI
jgi:hypothetical protein